MFKIIKAFCRLLSNYASPFVIASAIVAFFVPVAFGWVHGNVSSIILGVIMLSMGLTISMDDVRNLLKQPFHILLGAVAQYTIMPFVAFGLTKVFGLDPYLAVGIILVGCCPGGVSSNVMSFLARGDVTYSVSMTMVSTLLAPIMTPLLVLWLADTSIDVNAKGMFLNILYVTIAPITIGFLCNYFLGKRAVFKEIQSNMPAVSVIGLMLIVGGVVVTVRPQLFANGLGLGLNGAGGSLLHKDVSVLTVLKGKENQVNGLFKAHDKAGHLGLGERDRVTLANLVNPKRNHGTS